MIQITGTLPRASATTWLGGDLRLIRSCWPGRGLFVVGRSKEMLIVRGRNYPPYDVDRKIDQVPGVAEGQTVVFSLPEENRGREAVLAVAGTKSPEGEHDRIRTDIAAAVRSTFGFSIDNIVLVRTGSLPRTTSGKLQRVKVRELYLDRRLPVTGATR